MKVGEGSSIVPRAGIWTNILYGHNGLFTNTKVVFWVEGVFYFVVTEKIQVINLTHKSELSTHQIFISILANRIINTLQLWKDIF